MYDYVIKKRLMLKIVLSLAMITSQLTSEEWDYFPAMTYQQPINPIYETFDNYYNDSEMHCIEPCNSCCPQYFLALDLLYWRAFEEGLDGCGLIEATQLDSEDGSFFSSKRSVNEPHFNWNAGFRLGAGVLYTNGWDVVAYWTNYNTTAHRKQKNHQEHEFGFTLEDSSTPLTKTRLHWRIDFNEVDLLLGRNFSLFCDEINLRPFVGLRGAWITQKLHSRNNSIVNSSEEVDLFHVHKKNTQKFRGVGPLLGLQASGYIGCNFRLFGIVDFGLLYSDFTIRSRDEKAFVNNSSFCKTKKKLHPCEVFADAVLGLSWEYCFCNNMLLTLQVSAEHHRYFDHNKMAADGDLYFEGGAFSANIKF